ncbi:putative calcium-binding protein CML18 [Acorus calamus]|uniref:Calcium-binding protein CML18 n=1 Tax=Acorus calamus TaxID=4465 RepID=A0AAV9EJW2_ACOCL|nr:putative calcium-binding protein CML18 [Acorus calamus]
MEKVFGRFDVNGDGKISSEDLHSVFRSLGSAVSKGEVSRMMEQMNADLEGVVNLKAFSDFQAIGGEDVAGKLKDLREAFKMFDQDANELISAEELHKVMSSLGENYSVSDCEKMIRFFDSDGDGSVSFREFKEMMKGGFKASTPHPIEEKSGKGKGTESDN